MNTFPFTRHAMTPEQVKERAADLLIDAARDRRRHCLGYGDERREWDCLTCSQHDKCKTEHAEMVELAVKLRGNT